MKTKIELFLIAAVGMGLFAGNANAGMITKLITYKKAGDVELQMKVYYPRGWTEDSEPLPTVVLFHGGGWQAGDLSHFWRQAHHLALRGIISVAPTYRTKGNHDTGPDKSLEDAKSAMRYVRGHAKELGVDTTRLAAGGGSAGGHLAAATAFSEGFNAPDDDLTISCKPLALVLFNPVIDNGPGGFGHELVKDYWEDFSPLHTMTANPPPTLFMIGDKDQLISMDSVRAYKKKMDDFGARCDLSIYKDAMHSFFSHGEEFHQTVQEMDDFLVSLGYLKAKPKKIPPPRILPEKVSVIQAAKSLPETTPWNLNELSQPPDFEWDSGEDVRYLYYQGEMYQGKPTRVFACYATPGSLVGDPTLDQNLPAVVLVHGGMGTAMPQWVKLWASRGYAALAMDLNGFGHGKKPLPDGGPPLTDPILFGTGDQPDRDQWVYHAVANVIRAHSLLLSFPEVDPDRTGLTGISWGGFLSCIVAGLDDRFKAVVPVYGCGFIHERSAWLRWFNEVMTPEQKERWVMLWDASQYVGHARAPMLFVNGAKDFTFRPEIYSKTYDLVTSEKNICFLVDYPHGYILDGPPAIEPFMKHHLKGGPPLPKISDVTIHEKNVTAQVATKGSLVSAELNYTEFNLLANPAKRTFIKIPATIEGDRVIVSRPPDTTTMWFITVTDEEGITVSSEVML